MTQVYNYLFGRNPRVAIQPVDLGKTSGGFFLFFSILYHDEDFYNNFKIVKSMFINFKCFFLWESSCLSDIIILTLSKRRELTEEGQ